MINVASIRVSRNCFVQTATTTITMFNHNHMNAHTHTHRVIANLCGILVSCISGRHFYFLIASVSHKLNAFLLMPPPFPPHSLSVSLSAVLSLYTYIYYSFFTRTIVSGSTILYMYLYIYGNVCHTERDRNLLHNLESCSSFWGLIKNRKIGRLPSNCRRSYTLTGFGLNPLRLFLRLLYSIGEYSIVKLGIINSR